MIRGIDASINVAQYISDLQALSVTFIGRYYSNLRLTRNPAKILTPREAHDLSLAGFTIVAVWELLAIPEYFSAEQGLADGEYAYKYATEIRQPEDSAIYFAVDFDASQTLFSQRIAPYFDGLSRSFAASTNGPVYSVGVYGSGAVCAALKQAGLARFGWLSQSSGWQGSQRYQDWDIRQGPSNAQPPFQFDEDVAKDEFGGFRLNFQNTSELFATTSYPAQTLQSVRKKKAINRRGTGTTRPAK